jgi:hypothetical protein
VAEHEGSRLRPRGCKRLEEEGRRTHENCRAGAKCADDDRCEAEDCGGDREGCEGEGDLQSEAEEQREAGFGLSPIEERDEQLLRHEPERRHEGEEPERGPAQRAAHGRERHSGERDERANDQAGGQVGQVKRLRRHVGAGFRMSRQALDGDVRNKPADGRERDAEEPDDSLPSHVR